MLQYTTDDRTRRYRAYALCGLAFSIYVIVVMVLMDEKRWMMDGVIYLTLGVMGYFGLLCAITLYVRKPVLIARDGKRYEFTIWHLLAYGAIGGIAPTLFGHFEGEGLGWDIVPWIVVLFIALAIVGRYKRAT